MLRRLHVARHNNDASAAGMLNRKNRKEDKSLSSGTGGKLFIVHRSFLLGRTYPALPTLHRTRYFPCMYLLQNQTHAARLRDQGGRGCFVRRTPARGCWCFRIPRPSRDDFCVTRNVSAVRTDLFQNCFFVQTTQEDAPLPKNKKSKTPKRIAESL